MTEPTPNADRPCEAAWQVIEPYCEAVSIYDGPMVFLDGFDRLPLVARHLFAVWWCDFEVCNGGFHQFFSNSTGVLAPEALDGFRAIGLHECAELAEAAICKFGEPYPRDRKVRLATLQTIELPGEKRSDWDPFCSLDDRYYAAKKHESFDQKLDDFARQHTR